MDDIEAARWNAARRKVVERWHQVLERTRAQDDWGALVLVNSMKEFCDEALPTPRAAGEPAGARCALCRSFKEHGGCSALLQHVDKAILAGKWDKVRCLAGRHIGWLESMQLRGRRSRGGDLRVACCGGPARARGGPSPSDGPRAWLKEENPRFSASRRAGSRGRRSAPARP